MWSLEYVQVPERKLKRSEEVCEVSVDKGDCELQKKDKNSKSTKLDLFKQMNMSTEGNGNYFDLYSKQ